MAAFRTDHAAIAVPLTGSYPKGKILSTKNLSNLEFIYFHLHVSCHYTFTLNTVHSLFVHHQGVKGNCVSAPFPPPPLYKMKTWSPGETISIILQ